MKDGQTIGQWLKWHFKANGSLKIKDKNGNDIYHEVSDGRWRKREYDLDGNIIYHEDSCGFWCKREHDSRGNIIYFENSDGVIKDNRTPEIIEHNGRKYQLIP